MNHGDVVLIPLPQFAGGANKLRPALVLASLPGTYQNVLLFVWPIMCVREMSSELQLAEGAEAGSERNDCGQDA